MNAKVLRATLAYVVAFVLMAGAGSARAAEGHRNSGTDIRVLRFSAEVHVHADGRFTERDSEVIEALTRSGAQSVNPFQQTFSSSVSRLKVVSAWIKTPAGRHRPVPSSDVFVRPMAATQGAPMYSHAKVLNVVLPHFTKSDKLHVTTLLTQIKPYFPHQYFGVWSVGERQSARDEKVVVQAPVSMHLKAAQRDGWAMAHHIKGNTEIFTATLAEHHAHFPGPTTVDSTDYSPLLEVTSFPTWASVGKAYWARAKAEAFVTPRVKRLADHVAGKLRGWNAVKALYAWVSEHIRYVGLELGVGGFVPISANETLKTGYGDCKAHSTLIEALLAARGITAYPVLINWNNAFDLVPLPGPDFNHAIDYLPKYHVFLDATGEYETPGQLAVGERDKPVVVAGPHSELLHTPGGQPGQNHLEYRATLHLAPDGTLTGTARMTTTGWWAWFNRMIFAQVPSGAYKRLMSKLLNTSGGGEGSFEHGNPLALDRPFQVKAHWSAPAYAVPGKMLALRLPAGPYLVPSMGDTTDPISALAAVAGPATRAHSISTYFGGIDWHTALVLPPNYAPTYLPPAIDMRNAAGSFRFALQDRGGRIEANYRLRLTHVLYTPSQYADLRALLRADLRVQHTPLIFHHT